MKIKLTLAGVFGTVDIITNREKFELGQSYPMRLTGAVIVDERSDEEIALVESKIAHYEKVLEDEISRMPEKSKADVDRIELIELHLAAFRPHLDASVKRVELNLVGTKPTTLHSRASNLRQLEALDTLVDESKGEAGRPIVDIDGHRFRREENWSPADSTTRRVWFAIASNGEAVKVEPVGEKVNLVDLHKVIAGMHPNRLKAKLVPAPQGAIISKDDHRVIPEVIEALEEACKDGVSNMLGETGVNIQGAKYIRRRETQDRSSELCWYAQLNQ